MKQNNQPGNILERPTQAVILAGGRGMRLRPLTDTRPKPMIEIHGKPFLEYLVEMLRDQGFDHILLLLGYLPEVIQNYFGDGSRWGIEINYSVSAPDDGTAHRVKLVEQLLETYFLLMYCDNYWPMQIDKMWQRFVSANVPAMITVYSNLDGYSRDSVRIGQDGFVEVFDRTRTTPNLRGIEISYAILNKSVVHLLPEDPTLLFEEVVYPGLVEQRKLLSYVTDHRYYSVGGHDRLPLTETFLARRPAIMLDRDGVLNKKPPQAHYVRNVDEFEWLPGAREALRLLKEADYRVLVVSNQAGVGRGVMTEADLIQVHERMKREAAEAGGRIDGVYWCSHDWDEGCTCRKPNPGMLFQAQREFSLDLSRTVFIGDDERDRQAADAAGCPSTLISEGQSLFDVTCRLLNRMR